MIEFSVSERTRENGEGSTVFTQSAGWTVFREYGQICPSRENAEHFRESA